MQRVYRRARGRKADAALRWIAMVYRRLNLVNTAAGLHAPACALAPVRFYLCQGVRMTRDRLAYILSILAGLLPWSAAVYVSEKREPWDSDLYWTLFYPLAVLLSGTSGRSRRRLRDAAR